MNGKRDIRSGLDAVSFSLLDIMMYLDTHPNDAEALSAKARYEEACARLRGSYEEKYGPLTAESSGGDDCWKWIADPWPWEER